MGYVSRRTICVALALAGATPGPAAAITNGQPDEGEHPYVGALVTHNGNHKRKRLICSGVLIAPTVFATAAHCPVGEPDRLYVSFAPFVGAPDVGPDVPLHLGTAFRNPGYVDSTAPGDTHEVAVIRLDAPIREIEPAKLPQRGLLDQLQRDGRLRRAGIELAGYGREGMNDKGFFFGGGSRRWGIGGFSSLEPFKLISDQRGTLAGTCNGDSGAPVLQPATRTVLALVSDGDPECRVDGINYRLDTASARDFLDDHVAVP